MARVGSCIVYGSFSLPNIVADHLDVVIIDGASRIVRIVWVWGNVVYGTLGV